MEKYYINKRFFYIFTLISIVGFLIFPKVILAEDIKEITPAEIEKYLVLSENNTQKIIETLIQELTTEWIYLESSANSTAEERAVPIIMRKVVRKQVLNYMLVDAPAEASVVIIKNAVEIARLLMAQDISIILKKFEQETVKKAVDYAINALLQDEIRIAVGVMEFRYTSIKGNETNGLFQYINNLPAN